MQEGEESAASTSMSSAIEEVCTRVTSAACLRTMPKCILLSSGI